jgi:hypothetical protein
VQHIVHCQVRPLSRTKRVAGNVNGALNCNGIFPYAKATFVVAEGPHLSRRGSSRCWEIFPSGRQPVHYENNFISMTFREITREVLVLFWQIVSKNWKGVGLL